MRTFKLGPLGLTTKEIEQEQFAIKEAVCKRHGMSTDDMCRTTFSQRTPTEIHREAVLDAMRMANCLLCYDGPLHGKTKWDIKYAPEYHAQHIWDDRGYGPVRKFGCNKVQNEAYALTQEETEAIWKAQAERISKATILHNVHTGADGESYNAIHWDTKEGK